MYLSHFNQQAYKRLARQTCGVRETPQRASVDHMCAQQDHQQYIALQLAVEQCSGRQWGNPTHHCAHSSCTPGREPDMEGAVGKSHFEMQHSNRAVA